MDDMSEGQMDGKAGTYKKVWVSFHAYLPQHECDPVLQQGSRPKQLPHRHVQAGRPDGSSVAAFQHRKLFFSVSLVLVRVASMPPRRAAFTLAGTFRASRAALRLRVIEPRATMANREPRDPPPDRLDLETPRPVPSPPSRDLCKVTHRVKKSSSGC